MRAIFNLPLRSYRPPPDLAQSKTLKSIILWHSILYTSSNKLLLKIINYYTLIS